MVTVLSTCSKTTEKELNKNGFKIVIYTNHLLRASYSAMLNTAKLILKTQKGFSPMKKLIY